MKPQPKWPWPPSSEGIWWECRRRWILSQPGTPVWKSWASRWSPTPEPGSRRLACPMRMLSLPVRPPRHRSQSYLPISFRPSDMSDPIAAAREWLTLDPENAGVLTQEIHAADAGDETALTALTARFAGFLTFGTAGLRAPLGPGTARMNRVVVQRAAAGIADFAKQHIKTPSVVIGYDARHG